MNKNIISNILTKLKGGEIDLDEVISEMIELEEYELVEELEILHEVTSESKFTTRIEELIWDISNSQATRAITHKDLRDTKLIKESTINSLNEIIRNILKESQ